MNRTITFDEHREIAGQVLNLLEGVDRLWHYLQAITCDPTAAPGRQKAANKILTKVHNVGRATQRVQETGESDLSRQDHGDQRSWELYFPEDRPSARLNYA